MSESTLRELLGRLVDGNEATANDVETIARALTSSRESRGLAFLALKRIVDGASGNGAGAANDDGDAKLAVLLGAVANPLTHISPDTDMDPSTALPTLALAASLFPLAPKAAARILQLPLNPPLSTSGSEASPGGNEQVAAAADVMSLLLELAELDSPVQLALAEMLAAATGSKSGRAFVRSRAMEWLEGAVEYRSASGAERSNGDLGGLCAVALSKLGMAQDGDDDLQQTSADGKAAQNGMGGNEVFLADKMAGVIISTAKTPSPGSPSTLISALEGLSVLSTRPAIKHQLAHDFAFLDALLSLSPVPERKGGSLPVTVDGQAKTQTQAAFDPAQPIAPIDTGICYGITTILLHLSLRRPIQSADDEQMAKLRAMASAASISGANGKGAKMGDALDMQDALDEDEVVCERVELLYRAGVVAALSGLVRAASTQVKVALGRLCLMLVMEQRHRAVFVRDGGFKVLGAIIRGTLPSTAATGTSGTGAPTIGQNASSSEVVTAETLPALQALAKLAITTPPPLLFPPPHQTTALNALVPLYTLLTHTDTSVLQTFEALMALTNLASIYPSIADRIVTATIMSTPRDDMFRGKGSPDGGDVKVLAKVEELLMDDNRMIRRAATELACNLAGSPQGYAYLSGEGGLEEIRKADSSASSRAAMRIHLLLVLLDSDDLPTQLAAGGALAIVSESPAACAHMLSVDGQTSSKRSIWQRLADLFRPRETEEEEEGERITSISTEQPDEGMMMRGAVILANLLPTVQENPVAWNREKGKVDKACLRGTLLEVVQRGVSPDVMEPLSQALQCLKGPI